MESNSKLTTDQSNIIDGRAIATKLFSEISEQVKTLSFKPVLCDVVVGDDPVSLSYVGIKKAKAIACGFDFSLVHLPATSTDEEIIAAINSEQENKNLCGLIVQLPLPSGLNTERILRAINSEVDVDVINPDSATNLTSPTPGAIMHILDQLSVDLSQEKFLVLGQGDLVGKPVATELQKRNYEFSTAIADTENKAELLKSATVVITGVGKAKVLSGDELSDGVIVVDAGTSESGGSIQGDVDFESVVSKARNITPSPGGVGPVTVAKLLENVLSVAKTKN